MRIKHRSPLHEHGTPAESRARPYLPDHSQQDKPALWRGSVRRFDLLDRVIHYAYPAAKANKTVKRRHWLGGEETGTMPVRNGFGATASGY